MVTENNICVSIGNVPIDDLLVILGKVHMAEIRLDLAGFDEEAIKKVFTGHNNLIATCREGALGDKQRSAILESAINHGAAWVDIEADAGSEWRERMVKVVRSSQSKLILSRHFYTHTPPPDELRSFIDEMFTLGADVVKLACQVNHVSEAAALLGLYSQYNDLVAIGMGPLGVITRLAAPFLGAPFTFASYGDNPITAAGQIEFVELKGFIDKISSYG